MDVEADDDSGPPLLCEQGALVGVIAKAARLSAVCDAVRDALGKAGVHGAIVDQAAWLGPPLRVSTVDLQPRSSAPARLARIQVIAGCCTIEGRPLKKPIIIGLDRRVLPAWRLSVLVGNPDLAHIRAGLLRLLLDPLFTGELGANAATLGQRRLGRVRRQVAAYHLAHGLRDPRVPEYGRILWIDANPAVDTVLTPYGLAILNEIASRQGFLGAIVSPYTDFERPIEGTADLIQRFAPDLIGVSLRNIDDATTIRTMEGPLDRVDTTNFVGSVSALIAAIRRRFTGPMILGGAALTRSPEVLMQALGIRFAVQGPADSVVEALLRDWRPSDGSAIASFASVWRAIPGALTAPSSPAPRSRAQSPRVLPDLVVPVPRDPVKIWSERRLGIGAAVRGTYGCPLDCTYCLEATPRLRTQQRPATAVVDEMQWLHERYGIVNFHLTDSEANLPFSRMLSLAAEIVRRRLQDRITWTVYCTPRPFDVAAIPDLCAGGLRGLKLSADHFASTQLRSLGKVYAEAAVHELLAALVQGPASLRVGVSILFGAPGETLDTIDYVIHHIRRYAACGMEFYYNVGLRLYPGTPLFRDWQEGKLDARLCLGPGIHDGGVSPLIYCSPGPPRLLARRISDALSDCPSVHPLAVARPTKSDESLRRLHVVASRWFKGDVDNALTLLRSMGVPHSAGTRIAREALQLDRRLRRRMPAPSASRCKSAKG